MRSALLVLMMVAAPLHAATSVSLCDVLENPPAYDRQVLEMTVFVSFAFEGFTLFDPRCASGSTRVWYQFGGSAVEGVTTTLVNDKPYEQLGALVNGASDTIVHATLRGRYFAGEKQTWPGATFHGGFGHFGMFTLFVIEQVVAVDPHDLRDVDYRATADAHDLHRVDCVSANRAPEDHTVAIEQQKEAEAGEREWALTDHRRVAIEAVGTGPKLREVRKTPGRVVYKGRKPGSRNDIWVVVTRPYFLTFYAANRERVSWIATAVYETGCDE